MSSHPHITSEKQFSLVVLEKSTSPITPYYSNLLILS